MVELKKLSIEKLKNKGFKSRNEAMKYITKNKLNERGITEQQLLRKIYKPEVKQYQKEQNQVQKNVNVKDIDIKTFKKLGFKTKKSGLEFIKENKIEGRGKTKEQIENLIKEKKEEKRLIKFTKKDFKDDDLDRILRRDDIADLGDNYKYVINYHGRFIMVNVIGGIENIYKQIPEIIELANETITDLKGYLKGVLLYLYSDSHKDFRRVFIPADMAQDEKELIDYLEDFKDKTTVMDGSDVIEDSKYSLVNRVTLIYFDPIALGDVIKNPLLNIIDENKTSKGDCLTKIMSKFGYNIKTNKIHELTEYLKKINARNIVIYNNSIILSRNFKISKEYEIHQLNEGKNRRPNKMFKLINHDFKMNYIYLPEQIEGDVKYLLYANEHLAECSSFEEVKNNFYICNAHIYVKNNNNKFLCITDAKAVKNKIHKPNAKKNKFVYFDYESVIDLLQDNHPFKEYSLSYLELDPNELQKITEDDEKGNVDKWLLKVNHIFGFDCSEKFTKVLNDLTKEYNVTLIGFNNSNFDNFFITNEFFKNSENKINVFFNKNSILDFNINESISTLDLGKHLTGSLAFNCGSKGFNIKCFCKKSLDHEYAQTLFNNNKLLVDISFKEQLQEYNNFDVLCLPILHYKYESCINTFSKILLVTNGKEKFRTIGSLIYDMFKNNAEELKIKIPKFEKDQIDIYKNILSYSSAGRCDLRDNIKLKIFARIVSLDVCSLYPYIMAIGKYYYPAGDIIKTNKFNNDKLGFYWVSVDQTNLKQVIQCEKILDKNGKTKENNWTCKIIKKIYIGSERIKYLISKGCKVTNLDGGSIHDECDGIYFSDKVKGCDLFKPIIGIMKIKNREDTYKQNGDERLNKALRQTVKLLSNSLSGKVIEGLHLDKIVVMEHTDEKLLDNKYKPCQIHDNKVIVSYKEDEEKEFKNHRPVFYGAMIYAYAQEYLYEHIISKADTFYYDTDSAKMTYDNYLKWKETYGDINKINHWNIIENDEEKYKEHKIHESGSKIYGSFEDELKDCGEQKCSYFDAKKQYAIIMKNIKKSKITFKGMSVKYNDDGEIIENDVRIYPDQVIENKYKYYNEHKKIINDWESIFDDLHNGKPVLFLTSSWSRVVKEEGGNLIRQHNRIKIIGGTKEEVDKIKKNSCLFIE